MSLTEKQEFTQEKLKECINDLVDAYNSYAKEHDNVTVFTWFEKYCLGEDKLIPELLKAAIFKPIDDDVTQPQSWPQLALAAIKAMGEYARDIRPNRRRVAFHALSQRAFMLSNPNIKLSNENKKA